MKILFSIGNFGFLRNFEPALRLFAERGHDLHLVAESEDSVGGTRTLELLQASYPERIRFSYMPSRKNAVQLRLSLDYYGADGRLRRPAGRHAALPASEEYERRPAHHGAEPWRTRDAACAGRASAVRARREERGVHPRVRPYGLDVPVARRFVDAIAQQAAQPAPAP